MPVGDLIILLVLGLAAGILGGLLGIGGSVLMIPVITLMLDRNHHLSQAVAMIVNVFVALPAVVRHHRAGAVRWDAFVRFLPPALVFILLGVLVSNALAGQMLERIFGAFLLYIVFENIRRLVRRTAEPQAHEQRATWPVMIFIGTVTGGMAGLLGIGGGTVSVPLMQRVAALPLRQCIGTSSAVMCITAAFGAVAKNAALPTLTGPDGEPLGLAIRTSIVMAACLAPTAIIGGMLGANLTHTLSLRWVRLALIVLLAWAAMSMLGVPIVPG